MPIWPAELCVKYSVVSLLWQPLKGPLFPRSPSWSRMSPTPFDGNPPIALDRHSADYRTHSESRMPPCEQEPFLCSKEAAYGVQVYLCELPLFVAIPKLLCTIFHATPFFSKTGAKFLSVCSWWELLCTPEPFYRSPSRRGLFSNSRGTGLLCVRPSLVKLVSVEGVDFGNCWPFLFLCMFPESWLSFLSPPSVRQGQAE